MWGDTLHPGGGDTRVKVIKSDSDSDSDEQKKGFSGKNRGVTPSVAVPGVTHPSDATAPSQQIFEPPLLMRVSTSVRDSKDMAAVRVVDGRVGGAIAVVDRFDIELNHSIPGLDCLAGRAGRTVL